MRTFGRKVEPRSFSIADFTRLFAPIRAGRTFRERGASPEEIARLRYISDDASEATLPQWMGARLDAMSAIHTQPFDALNAYLEEVGIGWRLERYLIVPPDYWLEVGGNVLTYGLDLSPHDGWNIMLVVSHPVASIDMDMPFMAEPVIREQYGLLLDGTRSSLGAMNQDFELMQREAIRTGDFRKLAHACDFYRKTVYEHTARTRTMLARHYFALKQNRGPAFC